MVALYDGEYLEVASTNESYVIGGRQILKSDTQKFIDALKNSGTTKLLLQDFNMGDLLKVGSKLKSEGFSLFYVNDNEEIKTLNVF